MTFVVETTPPVSFGGHSKMEKLLTLQETAEILRVKAPTLYNWVSERRIATVKVGRLVRFDPKDIREFIEKNKRHEVKFLGKRREK